MGLTRDYVMRLVKQLAGALARVMGLRKAGKLEDALQLLGETQKELLGDADGMVAHVDAQTAARLLVHKDNVLIYAELLATRGDVFTEMHDEKSALRNHLRALEMSLEAQAMGKGSEEKTRELIQRLQPLVNVELLSTRYQDLLGHQT